MYNKYLEIKKFYLDRVTSLKSALLCYGIEFLYNVEDVKRDFPVDLVDDSDITFAFAYKNGSNMITAPLYIDISLQDFFNNDINALSEIISNKYQKLVEQNKESRKRMDISSLDHLIKKYPDDAKRIVDEKYRD